MTAFFEAITEFLIGILSGDPEAVRLRSQLKELANTVGESKPTVYQKSPETLLPAFAASWFQLYQLLVPLSEMFSKTIASPDRLTAEAALHALIESNLEDNVAQRRSSLSFSSLTERYASARSVEQEAQLVAHEFASLITDVQKQDTERWQQDFASLFRLRYLALHTWAALFSHFGHNISSGAREVSFHAVEAKHVIPELIDLYFLVAEFNLLPGVEPLLGGLLEKLNPARATDNKEKLSKILARLSELLRGPCSAALLLNLIRLIRKDPTNQLENLVIKERFIADYLATLNERCGNDQERAFRERNESSRERDIQLLFEGRDLEHLSHYSSYTNERLSAVGLSSLTWVKPLEVLLTFAKTELKGSYLSAVKKVLMGGIFTSKDWQSQLSDSMYVVEKITTNLVEFDTSLTRDGKVSLVPLEKYLSGQVPASTLSRQMVDNINRAASNLLEAEYNGLFTLSQRIQDLLNDQKSPHPTYITNIRSIGGANQREFIEFLIQGYNKNIQLLKTLSYYVVAKE